MGNLDEFEGAMRTFAEKSGHQVRLAVPLHRVAHLQCIVWLRFNAFVSRAVSLHSVALHSMHIPSQAHYPPALCESSSNALCGFSFSAHTMSCTLKPCSVVPISMHTPSQARCPPALCGPSFNALCSFSFNTSGTLNPCSVWFSFPFIHHVSCTDALHCVALHLMHYVAFHSMHTPSQARTEALHCVALHAMHSFPTCTPRMQQMAC